MDVLKPELVWIDGRCYRIDEPTFDNMASYQEEPFYENDTNYPEADDDEDIEINSLDGGRYKSSLHVPSPYFGALIGSKGSVLRRLEIETKSEIKVPRQGQKGDVQIYGPTPNNVKMAYRRVNAIVELSRFKKALTHFISIPMTSPAIKANFEKFKKAVLDSHHSLSEDIFMPVGKLHLTLDIMALMDDEERQLCSNLLKEAAEKYVKPLLGGKPLLLRLKGVSYMNDDPTSIRVLYADAKEEDEREGILQTICDAVVDHFARAGFINKRKDSVKIHCTLMNVRYLPDVVGERKSFDGSKILEEFADFDFGTQELTCLHLSQVHTVGEDGFYIPTSVVSVV